MKSTTIEILEEAKRERYAVGAFNTANLEVTQAIVRAAHDLNKACVIQMTPSTMKYANHKVIGKLVGAVIENESNSTPIGFHLDHGKNFDHVVAAIDAGADSVMIDGSQLSFKENVELTARVVEYAHGKNVTVQAELGRVPYVGREKQEINWDEVMTDPDEAEKLVKKTGLDVLAVGIGNAHGFFREREEMDWERLKKIRDIIPDTLLVVHGASDWKVDGIKKAVEIGVSCFNVDTDVRVAFMTSICNTIGQRCEITDPRKILSSSRDAMEETVKNKIKIFRGE